MAKRNNIPSEFVKKAEVGSKWRENPTDPALERRLHQDLALSKGERAKGSSPAYAMGKKVEKKERRGT